MLKSLEILTVPISEKLMLTVKETIAYSGVKRSTLYVAMAEGRLKPRKFGRRTFIERVELDRFVASQPDRLQSNNS